MPRTTVATEPQPQVTRRRFLVPVLVVLEVDDRVLRAVDDEWRQTFYRLADDRDVAAHLAYNLVQGRSLSSLDGFADQPDERAEVVEVDVDDDGHVEELIRRRWPGDPRDVSLRSSEDLLEWQDAG